jgi:hypothetical protein
MATTDLTTVMKWVAWAQVAFGTAALLGGLRARGRPGEILAPLGAASVVTGSLRTLRGAIPANALIPLGTVLFAAWIVWFVRISRAGAARRNTGAIGSAGRGRR